MNKKDKVAQTRLWRQRNVERMRAVKRAWYKNNPDKQRRYALAKHGISEADYLDILADQGGGCAICGAKPQKGPFSLCVDHDHACCPGEFGCESCVRGLLCLTCNSAIGLLKEDPRLFITAIQYLTHWRP